MEKHDQNIQKDVPRMFFIVGMARSGTSLLRTIFDEHKNTLCPPESLFALALRKKYSNRIITNSDIDGIVEILQLDRKFELFWNPDFKKIKSDLKTILQEPKDFKTVVLAIYQSYSIKQNNKNVRWIGDKNPSYSFEIKWFKSIFGDAKFIHIVRNYKDCIGSHNRVFKRKSLAELAVEWVETNTLIEKMKDEHPESFHTIRYEDLVNNPQKELKSICDFLDIEFNDSILNFHKSSTAGVNNDLGKPIHTGNIGKYNQFTSSESALIDWICYDVAKLYSYNANEKPIKKWMYNLRLLIGRIKFFKSKFIRQLYFKTPIFIRKLTRRLFDFLFRKFRMSSHNNYSEMKSKEIKERNSRNQI